MKLVKIVQLNATDRLYLQQFLDSVKNPNVPTFNLLNVTKTLIITEDELGALRDEVEQCRLVSNKDYFRRVQNMMITVQSMLEL